jgi:proteasome lid subunit RPN8/RPN11
MEAVLLMSGSVFRHIRAHALESYPGECCGLLVSNEADEVVGAVRMKNEDENSDPPRYSISSESIRGARSSLPGNLRITGVYHSHPNSNASLSLSDLEYTRPWLLYLVVGMKKGQTTEIRAWRMGFNRMNPTEIELKVEDSSEP